jgi:hypothetical protein
MSKLISFRTAELANKRGYPQKEAEYGFTFDGNESPDFSIDFINAKAVARPTQDQLQTWLENKGMYISIAPEFYQDGINWNFQVLWYEPKENWEWITVPDDEGKSFQYPQNIVTGTGWYGDNGEYPSRHLGIEAALHLALMKLDFFYRHNSIDKLAKLYKINQNDLLTLIRPFSAELGDWGFNNLTTQQLEIITNKLGKPQ